MALVDSEAAFEQRLGEVIQDAAVRVAIQNQGIRSFSTLAFSCGTPQSPPNDEVFRAFADNVCPLDTIWQHSALFEGFILKLQL